MTRLRFSTCFMWIIVVYSHFSTGQVTSSSTPCSFGPCLNNGTCQNLNETHYHCSCQQFFTGVTCQTELTRCDPNPCENKGTCRNIAGGFECTCSLGYTGARCETDVDECASNPCLNKATCQNHINKYTCICPEGFAGYNCEQVPVDTFNQIVVPCAIAITSGVPLLAIVFYCIASIFCRRKQTQEKDFRRNSFDELEKELAFDKDFIDGIAFEFTTKL